MCLKTEQAQTEQPTLQQQRAKMESLPQTHLRIVSCLGVGQSDSCQSAVITDARHQEAGLMHTMAIFTGSSNSTSLVLSISPQYVKCFYMFFP